MEIGDVGHILVILSFFTSIIATYAYVKSMKVDTEQRPWKRFARTAFYVHGVSVIGVVMILFIIIYTHQYQYHYAWSHSSNNLPVHYMISCFWEGQEGSFLLWIFWHVILGTILIRKAGQWEAPVMAVFSGTQIFLTSMILGSVIIQVESWDFMLKLGSSPFILLKEFMPNAAVFNMDPNFVPEDGTGLNPLLQNYWMVIHPPTLFLGFATTLVPFSYCIAGLWTGKVKDWIKPALPWTLFSAAILGLGILMGGYWAYETLNFGGYWNWDPVENAVYVPWLTMIAALHAMVIFRRNGTNMNTTVVMICATYVLILYSTFLTRSGILGDTSVHSFTDLGLYGQLVIYLIFFTILSIFLTAKRWKSISGEPKKEKKIFTAEFWLLAGIVVLSLSAFQIILPTSIPVFNKLFGLKLAPPADQMDFYGSFQIWPAMIIIALTGIAQLYWWTKEKTAKKVLVPFIFIFILLLIASFIIVRVYNERSGIIEDVQNQLVNVRNADKNVVTSTPFLDYAVMTMSYTLLLAASIFGIIANLFVAVKLVKSKISITSGSVAHIGLGLMLVGILFSSGYSKIVSVNTSGKLYSSNLSDEMNLENVLLWRNKPSKMGEYTMKYKRSLYEPRYDKGWINTDWVKPNPLDPNFVIAEQPVQLKDKVYETGDTIEIFGENQYFEIEYQQEGGNKFTLYPRAQVNPKTGLIASPDVKKFFGKDLYTHVSTIPDPDREVHWSDTSYAKVPVGGQFMINDFITYLDSVRLKNKIEGVAKINEDDRYLVGYLRILTATDTLHARSKIILAADGNFYTEPEVLESIGAKVNMINVNPENGEFTFGVNTRQLDYIIMKAALKPGINLLWGGALIILIGFGMAIKRRIQSS